MNPANNAATFFRSNSASSYLPAYGTAFAGMKTDTSGNYYMNSKNKHYTYNNNYNNDYGGDGTNANGDYQMYAPVYEGPNGQLYSNGQVYPVSGSNSSAQALPSSTSIANSAYSMPITNTHSFSGTAAALSTGNKGNKKSTYPKDIERIKNSLTGFGKREDSESSDSSSSEEDSIETRMPF